MSLNGQGTRRTASNMQAGAFMGVRAMPNSVNNGRCSVEKTSLTRVPLRAASRRSLMSKCSFCGPGGVSLGRVVVTTASTTLASEPMRSRM